MPEEKQPSSETIYMAIRHYADLVKQAPSTHHAVPHLEPILDIYDHHENHRKTIAEVLLPELDEHINSVRSAMAQDEHFHRGHSDYTRVMASYESILQRLEKLKNYCA